MVAEERSFLTCAKLSTVDSEIDYTKHAEPELVDMFERLDPRYAPTECARLAPINDRDISNSVPRVISVHTHHIITFVLCSLGGQDNQESLTVVNELRLRSAHRLLNLFRC